VKLNSYSRETEFVTVRNFVHFQMLLNCIIIFSSLPTSNDSGHKSEGLHDVAVHLPAGDHVIIIFCNNILVPRLNVARQNVARQNVAGIIQVTKCRRNFLQIFCNFLQFFLHFFAIFLQFFCNFISMLMMRVVLTLGDERTELLPLVRLG
jgi:hypothetical protein